MCLEEDGVQLGSWNEWNGEWGEVQPSTKTAGCLYSTPSILLVLLYSKAPLVISMSKVFANRWILVIVPFSDSTLMLYRWLLLLKEQCATLSNYKIIQLKIGRERVRIFWVTSTDKTESFAPTKRSGLWAQFCFGLNSDLEAEKSHAFRLPQFTILSTTSQQKQSNWNICPQ